jgi:hypothetical protein
LVLCESVLQELSTNIFNIIDSDWPRSHIWSRFPYAISYLVLDIYDAC